MRTDGTDNFRRLDSPATSPRGRIDSAALGSFFRKEQPVRESIKRRTAADIEALKVEYEAALTKMDFWIEKYNDAQKKVADLEATIRTLTRLSWAQGEPEKKAA